MENYTFNEFLDELSYQEKEKLNWIKNSLEMSPLDEKTYDDAYRCLQEILHSSAYNDTQIKLITDEFRSYVYDARDKLILQHMPFHGFWIAEIIALVLNIYFLPNMMSALYSENYGEIFCMFFMIFEISLISLTIFGIGFLNSDIKHKKYHSIIIISWIGLTYLVIAIANLNYLVK